ncbi:unnamed protein product [Orchesella dallaii]|uniref:EGF-like domain-containing protein n=1 Tax=Orchesella dallaii TaxID=48710 RepID=A0ABP1RFG9_9HEXA
MLMFSRTLIIWRFLLFLTLWNLANGESYPHHEPFEGSNMGHHHYYGDGAFNGKKCDAQTKCKAEDGFVCIDGMCACQYSQQQLSSEKKCLSLVHGPCLTSKNVSLPCTANAKCVPDLQSYNYHKCVCADGYIESHQRTCHLAYGQPCGNDRSQICDHIGGLACVEGTCKCRDDLQVYNEKEKKCKGIVGAICQFLEHDFCVGGTSCEDELRGYETIGLCKCDPGLKWNGEKCEK